jgi:hypothetical protein
MIGGGRTASRWYPKFDAVALALKQKFARYLFKQVTNFVPVTFFRNGNMLYVAVTVLWKTQYFVFFVV